jgi:arabidopsis histidine kinase 2/3/4 (cytokinin receptor)
MLDMLLDTDLKSTQKDYAQTAQACGKALISLINEVLDRAKIEAGKLDLELVPFDLRSILDDVISLFSSKSRDKGIEVSSSYSITIAQKQKSISHHYLAFFCIDIRYVSHFP